MIPLVGTPDADAEIVAVVTAAEPLYLSVTACVDAVTDVAESVNAPVVSLFVNVTADAYVPVIVLPSASLSATVTGVVAAVPATNVAWPAVTERAPATPSTPSATANGVPEAIVCVAVPRPSTLPVAFAPS